MATLLYISERGIFDEIGVNCGRYTIFLSKFAIRFEYVSFAGGPRCCPKFPHLGVYRGRGSGRGI